MSGNHEVDLHKHTHMCLASDACDNKRISPIFTSLTLSPSLFYPSPFCLHHAQRCSVMRRARKRSAKHSLAEKKTGEKGKRDQG